MVMILSRLLEITVYSAVLLAAILAVKAVFRNKMSPAMHYIVWFLLIARLCIPVTIDSGLRLVTIPASDRTQTISAALDAVSDYTGTPKPVASNPDISGNAAAPAQQPASGTAPAEAVKASGSPLDWLASLRWPEMLFALWIAGILIVAVWMTAAAVRVKRFIRRRGMRPDAHVSTIAQKCRDELAIGKAIPLYVLPDISTPALTVSLRPVMILPENMVRTMSDERLAFAIRHELMHYKRRDNILSIGIRLLEAVYWFNPVVWLMGWLMLADMETACDNMVVQSLEAGERKRYALTLVDMFSQQSPPRFLLGMALNNTERVAKRRIRGIYMNSRSRIGMKLTAGLLCAVLAVCCFTTACQPTPEQAVVIDKSNDTLESALAATPAPESTPVQTVKTEGIDSMVVNRHWTDSVASKLTTVNIDADVVVPNVTAHPVYEVKPIVVDQALMEKFVNHVAQDAASIRNGDVYSKEDVEEGIVRLQKEITEVEAGNTPPDDFRPAEEQLASLRSQLQAAQEQYAKLEAEGDTTGQPLDYTFETEYGFPERTVVKFSADMKDGSGRLLRFERCDEGGPTFSLIAVMDIDSFRQGKGKPVSSEEARAKALEVIDDLDIGEFMLTGETTTSFYTMVTFSRTFAGIPVTDINASGGNSSGVVTEEELVYNFVLWQETLRICVNESGVILIDWSSPCETTRAVNENVALKPVDDIKEIFKQQILFNVYEADGSEDTVMIDEMRLSYMAIPEKDDLLNYRLIPVWDFIGPSVTDPDEIAEMELHGSENQNISYLTVNAIDGSIIDRNLGY